MNYTRFSSSGLAWAHFDILTEQGYDCHVAFRPRYHRDPQPFLVDWSNSTAPANENDESEDPQSWMPIAA